MDLSIRFKKTFDGHFFKKMPKVSEIFSDICIAKVYIPMTEVIKMSISPYQVDSVIKAYSKQNRIQVKSAVLKNVGSDNQFVDVVSLSTTECFKSDAYQKISYSLVDILLRGKGR